MSCCPTCMKWTIIILNVIVLLVGLVAVGFGVYILVDKQQMLELLGNTSEMPAFLDKTVIVLIVGGSIIAFVAAIGVCGACKNHRRMLCIYAVWLTLAMVIQLVAVILAVVYKEEIEKKFKSALNTSLRESYRMPPKPNEGVNAFSSTWDSIQYELECCGVVDHNDYRHAAYWIQEDNLEANDTHWPVPLSCCKYTNPWYYPDSFEGLSLMEGSCFPEWGEENTWIDAGCYDEIKSQLMKASLMIIGVAACTCICQLLLLIFAWALYCGCCGTKEVLV